MVDSELRIFIEDEGFYTIRELLTDESGDKLVGLNPLLPMGRTLDELKNELMEYIEALNKPYIKEGELDYFTLEYEESPPDKEKH